MNESNNVTLTCNTSGIASPTIQWTKVDEDAVLFVGPVYTIYNISRVPGNTVWYRCSSNNRTEIPTFDTVVNIIVQCEYVSSWLQLSCVYFCVYYFCEAVDIMLSCK